MRQRLKIWKKERVNVLLVLSLKYGTVIRGTPLTPLLVHSFT